MTDGKSISNRRIALALVIWVAYGLAFMVIHRLIGLSVAMLNIVPVLSTGWLLGVWAGLIASLSVFPVSLFLLFLSGEASWNAMTHGAGLTGSILLVLIGTAIGLLHDKVEQVRQELARRAKAEETLRKTQENLQLQIERMPIGCVMWDPEFHVLSWNPAATRIFGFTRDEALGKHPYDLIVPKNAQTNVDRTWQRLLEGDITATSLSENTTKDGRTIICSWTNTPLKDDGKIVGVLSMVQDITKRERAEEQLRESEERIRQILKMEAIGQLAGGIAHDFNNILMVILGFSDVLLASLAVDDPLHDHVRTIKTAALRAGDLTNQLLAFSRKQMLQPRIVCLNELVREGEKILRRLIREDIALIYVLSPDAGQVKVDPGQVSQILMNLTANARDAMPQRGKLIIETRNVEFTSRMMTKHTEMQLGRYVMMAISDTGVGIDNATKSHLFEPFFTTKELGKGTGLGLATIYGIVKQSSGYIYAYSEIDKGATFKIYFPRFDTPNVPEEERHRESEESLRGTETILLVEDEEEVRSLVRVILQNNGYTVVEARNGEEAVRICKEMRTSIHGMVTDIVMPQMGGQEAARQIKQIFPSLVVLFMTGYTEHFVKLNEMLEQGMSILQKPLRAEDLLRQLRASLGRIGRQQKLDA